MRTAWKLGSILLAAAASSCTVMYELDSYSSGRDTGMEGDSSVGADARDETLELDSNATDTGPVDSNAADTGVVATDTLVIDSSLPDSVGVDGLVADTAATDSFRPDTTAAPDSSASDSASTEAATDSSVTDAADAPPPLGCRPVINEVQTRSTASGLDEFVELYNPCDVEISLAAWKFGYRSTTGTTESNLLALPATAKIPAKGFFILANAGGAFAATADATYTSGLADDGAVGLRDAAAVLVDSVGWGAAPATNPFVEKAAAPGPLAGASISRVPNGTDSGDNSLDFKRTSPATPRS